MGSDFARTNTFQRILRIVRKRREKEMLCGRHGGVGVDLFLRRSYTKNRAMRLMKSSKHSFDNSKTPFDIAFSLKEWQYYFPYTLVTGFRISFFTRRILLLQTSISTSLLQRLVHCVREDTIRFSSKRIFICLPSFVLGTVHSLRLGVDQSREWRIYPDVALLRWKERKLEVPTRHGWKPMVSEQKPTA